MEVLSINYNGPMTSLRDHYEELSATILILLKSY